MSPMGGIGAWLDDRTGWRRAGRAWLEHPVVGGAPWASAMCAAALACFGVLALTGLTLMTAYAPSPQAAWGSVFYLQEVLPRGWIVRGLHASAAHALLLLGALHVVHGAVVASYRAPREVGWWLTLAVLALALLGSITGGLLPWDQLGWWARVVEGNIAGLAPFVGGWLQAFIQGGPELGALGLARAYAAHVAVVPVALAVVLVARRRIMQRHGWASPAGPAVSPAASRPYRELLPRDVLVAGAVVMALFAVTGASHGAPLDAPADPMSDYPARPEAYLLSLYELRKLFHGPAGEFWGTSLVPAAAAAFLALLPWIDRPARPRAAVVYAPLLAIVGGAVALWAVARSKDAHDPRYARQRAQADRVATAALRIARGGVPPAGALAMVREDPELRGRALFSRHCASCHVLGDLGDAEKATGTRLDGWGTARWISAMIHEPDAAAYFGRGPYKGRMPSVDVRPADKPPGERWSPMVKSDAERAAVAAFLASEGDEPGEPRPDADAATLALGAKIVSDRCTTCHLYKGDGDLGGSGDAPDLTGYGSIAWTRAQVGNPASPQTYRDKALGEDLKKHMPRFDRELPAADVELVARWTRAHGRGGELE